MNNYLLDTNILIFLVYDNELISKKVSSILTDSKSKLHTNSICIGEFIHLSKLRKITKTKNIYSLIESLNIKVIPMEKKDFDVYEKLDVSKDANRDSNDHRIIVQAISRGYNLISSDTKFLFYEKDGMKLIFNKK